MIRSTALTLLAILVFACGPNAKEKTVMTTLTVVNASRAAFIVWSDKTQDEIIKAAGTAPEGQAALAKHREERSKIVAAFEATYYALAIAESNLSDINVSDVLVAAGQLYTVYKEIVGKDPPTAPIAPAEAPKP